MTGPTAVVRNATPVPSLLAIRTLSILVGLTPTEAHAALAWAMRRFPALDWSIQPGEGDAHSLAVDSSDAERYPDIVARVVAEARPHRLRLADIREELDRVVQRACADPTMVVLLGPVLERWLALAFDLPLDGLVITRLDVTPPLVVLDGDLWLFEGRGFRRESFSVEIASRVHLVLASGSYVA